jgi:phosphoribosylanthranilate isomerase
MTLVKICGITNLEDAFASVSAGADALGFNFYRASPRYIQPSAARRIIDQLPRHVLNVGVFVNESTPEAVREIAAQAGVTAFQLHGDESPEYCAALADSYVIKAISASALRDDEIQTYQVTAIMLDAGDKRMRGGTGRTFDWSVASKLVKLVPKLFLAGGLSPDNVDEAIRQVRPFAIDACSALEHAPGRKDHDRLRAFIKKARSVKP